MDDVKHGNGMCNACGHCHDCRGCGGMGGFGMRHGRHGMVRLIIKILFVLAVFWLGVHVGEFRTFMHAGYGLGRGDGSYGPGMMYRVFDREATTTAR